MLKTPSLELVQLNVGAVGSAVHVYLVHAVLVALFSFSLCSSFLSGAGFSVQPGWGFVPQSELQGEL